MFPGSICFSSSATTSGPRRAARDSGLTRRRCVEAGAEGISARSEVGSAKGDGGRDCVGEGRPVFVNEDVPKSSPLVDIEEREPAEERFLRMAGMLFIRERERVGG